MRNPQVSYFADAINIESRGFIDYISLGSYRNFCTIDFDKRSLKITKIRWARKHEETYDLRDFDAVDYSYKLLGSGSDNGVHQDLEEFSVGLRFKSKYKVLALASFRGTLTSGGLVTLVMMLLPESWGQQHLSHELQARSLTNILCQKMNLKLAI